MQLLLVSAPCFIYVGGSLIHSTVIRSYYVKAKRMSLFGHINRMPENSVVKKANEVETN
jgi:hypothetical protein